MRFELNRGQADEDVLFISRGGGRDRLASRLNHHFITHLLRSMKMVRDIKFSRVEPVHIGKMTHAVWTGMSEAWQSSA
jgi:hypothetical protein